MSRVKEIRKNYSTPEQIKTLENLVKDNTKKTSEFEQIIEDKKSGRYIPDKDKPLAEQLKYRRIVSDARDIINGKVSTEKLKLQAQAELEGQQKPITEASVREYVANQKKKAREIVDKEVSKTQKIPEHTLVRPSAVPGDPRLNKRDQDFYRLDVNQDGVLTGKERSQIGRAHV